MPENNNTTKGRGPAVIQRPKFYFRPHPHYRDNLPPNGNTARLTFQLPEVLKWLDEEIGNCNDYRVAANLEAAAASISAAIDELHDIQDARLLISADLTPGVQQ